MPPTILIIGATGNTGRSVVHTLPHLLKTSKNLSTHRILALTRSASSPTAQTLAAIPGVELAEQNWIDLTAAWLLQHEVTRVFIASHNEPSQFADESQFYIEALRAGVKYVVRISTTAANVRPETYAYYPRTHWAIENLLAQPGFEALQWTSLQPNLFFSFALGSAAQFIQQVRATGKQESALSVMLDAETPVGVIDAWDVGVFAAHLLAEDDPAQHDQVKYVLNGPEDITGAEIVKLVEERIGAKVESVKFKDMSAVEQWADATTVGSKNVIRSVTEALVASWEGKAKAETTSRVVLELSPPKGTASEALDELLA